MASTDQPPKSHNLAVTLGLAGLGWVAMGVQELLLFLRPTPLGERYVGLWKPYLVYALVYNLYGVMLASAPAVIFWLVTYGRSIRPAMARRVHQLQLGLLTLTVVLDHLDNEVMRFMGIHLTYGLLRTYWKVNAWGEDMFHIISGDEGGPGLPFLILILVPLALGRAPRHAGEAAEAVAAAPGGAHRGAGGDPGDGPEISLPWRQPAESGPARDRDAVRRAQGRPGKGRSAGRPRCARRGVSGDLVPAERG